MHYKQNEKYLLSRIPQSSGMKFPAELGLARTKKLIAEVGNPDRNLKIIHIAGTSGKGSTAKILSKLLQTHDKNVGVHISPHLLDMRERFEINDALVTKEIIEGIFPELEQAVARVATTEFGQPTYFEIIVALALLVFRHQQVDYAILETGLGGTFDGTNAVTPENKFCILTPIDYDHQHILGYTIPEIASHKAGIVHAGNITVCSNQSPEAERVFRARAETVAAEIYFSEEEVYVSNVYVSGPKTRFNFRSPSLDITELELSLTGKHQAQNATTALLALEKLALRDNFKIGEAKVRRALAEVEFFGRFTRIQTKSGREVILDGAHNTHKMQALVHTLQEAYPGEKFTFLLGFKHNKNFTEMRNIIQPVVHKTYTTTFSLQNDLQQLSISQQEAEKLGQFVSPEDICEFISSFTSGKSNRNPSKNRYNQNGSGQESKLVITGSLYLLASLAARCPELRPEY